MTHAILQSEILSDGYSLRLVKSTGEGSGRRQYMITLNPPNMYDAPDVFPNLRKQEAEDKFTEILKNDICDTR